MAQNIVVTLKVLFRHSRGILSRMLFGDNFEWQNIEQPEVRNLRADLLTKSSDGSFRHIEFQLNNEPNMQAFVTPSTRHRYTILALREMDGTELLESDDCADMIGIMENKILGPAIHEGLSQGRTEGMVLVLNTVLGRLSTE